MVDIPIQNTQVWLNATYATIVGWSRVPESGTTGWSTIYGLRMALQSELGISPVSSGFGPATRDAYITRIGSLSYGSDVPENVFRILNGALFCKGISGTYKVPGVESFEFLDIAEGITVAAEELGLQDIGADPTYTNAKCDVKLAASLLSMDAYSIPWASGGSQGVREVQQWLNRNYASRRDFALIPCDGLFSRQIQTALLFALQYEFGMADGTANGNFGPGTRSGLRTQAQLTSGSRDTSRRYVRLFQAALVFNGFDQTPFNGVFDSATRTATRAFQEFLSLPVTGDGDYATWCSLLVSSGDPDAATTGLDTNRQVTSAAEGIRDAGYTHVGRYVTGLTTTNGTTVPKFLGIDELVSLSSAGLRAFPIMQVFNNAAAMTYED